MTDAQFWVLVIGTLVWPVIIAIWVRVPVKRYFDRRFAQISQGVDAPGAVGDIVPNLDAAMESGFDRMNVQLDALHDGIVSIRRDIQALLRHLDDEDSAR